MMTTSNKRHERVFPDAATATAPVSRHLLDNGLAVVLCPRPHLSQAHVSVYFGVGSRHETAATNGITHFLEHMLFRGSRSYRDATALNAAAEDLGGFLDGATYRDHLALATGCHPSAVGQAIRILGEVAQTPRYLALEVERSIIREELLEGLDAQGRSVDLDNVAHQLTFPRHGLALPIEGTLHNLNSLQRSDLEAHRTRFLVGANAVVSVAGRFDAQRVLDSVEAAFGSLPMGMPPLVETPPAPKLEPVVRHVRDPSSQVDMRLSFRAVPVKHPLYPALVMLSRLLADGLASRMHADLVDKRGLAYALHAGLGTYGDCGLFDFEVSVASTRAAEAVAAILDFASSAGRFRYTAEELGRVRRRFRYGIEFMADAPSDLASWYGRATLFGVEDEMTLLMHRLGRISSAEIRAAARSIFRRQGLVVTAVGQLARGEWSRVRSVIDAWTGW